jgi:2-dehydro-3-deoxyphosphogluconate aldolase/(4S)-4-hydroxy-2-oxoglutarate aldolase
MNQVFDQISKLKLVPVVKIEAANDALALGEALIAGGLPLAEITFRTDAAARSIRILSDTLPELLVGAGTVLTIEQVRQATAAGARFIVAPGFNPTVVDYCLDQGIPVVPGVNSPTQIEMGLERGLEVLKFFPAEASGGLKFLKAVAAPYGGVSFIPTGGISPGNLLGYLAFERVLACGGSWLAKTNLISAGRFGEITRLTREAVDSISSMN